ncbi:MAG: class I SAM-dependent methyltransferase [Methylococcaceae bacterium]|nr:class I SAM-dependent methyltransferase [Methylococcaceae bacterium]
MHRIVESELMEDEAQVIAYAEADFDTPHSQFIERLKAVINNPDFSGLALDLGCGPGDISRRFVEAYPDAILHAVDGSETMIRRGQLLISPALQKRIRFVLGCLPSAILPNPDYDIIFSNSLLHHLHEPLVLWNFIKHYARPGTCVAIMDLLRPDSKEIAQFMVESYAANEPKILQQDFYNSLLAAFTLEEIKQQLESVDLTLNVGQSSDRHVFISGVMP